MKGLTRPEPMLELVAQAVSPAFLSGNPAGRQKLEAKVKRAHICRARSAYRLNWLPPLTRVSSPDHDNQTSNDRQMSNGTLSLTASQQIIDKVTERTL